VTISLSDPVRLWSRLLGLALVVVIVQEAAVSQITVFGTSADLTPLVVMSVGLLAGSIPGAIMGFGTGLLVDIVLFQTLGVTSLLYIAIGYWSGRLRELRDPAHGLVPMGLGAAATAFAGLGMALIQFLLGVDSPVSLLLLQQILISVLVNTLISIPVYAVVRWVLRSAIPEDPRRRRRRHRAYTTGGLSPLQDPAGRQRPSAADRLSGGRRPRRASRSLAR
jgi:rod shape-determining protein MreD